MALALLRLAARSESHPVSIAELLDAFGRQAPAALVLLFAVPNILPMPPGTSAILGTPLLLLTTQLALGSPPWLPQSLRDRTLPKAAMAPSMRRLAGWLVGRRGLFKPRLTRLLSPTGVRAAGAVSSLLALILLLPIPFGNMLPALAISLFALGMLRGDGLWVLGGYACAALAVALLWGLVVTVGEATLHSVLRLLA